MWADSHCHIPFDEGDHQLGTDAIDQARRAGVARLISVGTDAASSAAVIEVARAHPEVWATVGLHPHEAKAGVETLDPLLAELDRRVVAIGECGLDYFYDHSPRAAQRAAFAAQIGLAHEHHKTLVIHTRDAWDDTFDILAAEGVPERTVFHCFTGGVAESRRALALGAFLSFSGIITFKNAGDIREAARYAPPERLLVETDSPFLAPVPHRGEPNRPAWVAVVGEALAGLRRADPVELAELTWANTARAFALGPEGEPASAAAG